MKKPDPIVEDYTNEEFCEWQAQVRQYVRHQLDTLLVKMDRSKWDNYSVANVISEEWEVGVSEVVYFHESIHDSALGLSVRLDTLDWCDETGDTTFDSIDAAYAYAVMAGVPHD